MKIEFVPRGSGSTLTLDDKAIASVDAARTHTALGDFVVRVRGDRRLETRAQRQDRVHIKQGGVTQFTGFLTGVRHRSSGQTELRGKGIGKLLQESRPSTRPVTYDNIFAGDAIEDYWTRTQFGNVTVTKQSGTTVVSDSLTQSADTTAEWNDIVTIPDDVPAVVENGKLKQVQSAFVDDRNGGQTDPDFSGGVAELLSSVTQDFTYTFTTEYDIDKPEFYLRDKVTDPDDNVTTEVLLDGVGQGTIDDPDTTTSLDWQSVSLGAITSGSHTIKIKPVDISNESYGQRDLDVFAVVDADYSYRFDNTVNKDNGYLDGPALYPTDAKPTVATQPTTTTRNIVNATLETTINDTSNDQRLGLSDDGGATFSNFPNTTSFTAVFNSAGRELVSQFRLSGYDNGARNATPRFNYLGQEIDSFNTKVDLDDRIVFVGVELSKNHFDNLQKLHENSDYIFAIDHDDGDPANMPVLSFPRGDEGRSASVLNNNAIDESPEVNTDRFYNTIPVEGGEDNNGNRPFEEVKDSNSISNVGDEISPGLLRDPTLNSSEECLFKAQALLDKALKNQDLRGQKVVPGSISLLPGASYSVGFLDDSPSEKVLEETRLRLSADGDAELTADFVAEETLRREIADLRRNQRQTADRL